MTKLNLFCLMILLTFSNCQTVNLAEKKNSSPLFSLKNCYHYWYGINNKEEVENYISHRVYLEFTPKDSSFIWEVCPKNTEGIIYYTTGNYSQNKNEISFLKASSQVTSKLRTISSAESIPNTKHIQLYLPIESDTLWLLTPNREIAISNLEIINIDKTIYTDSIFLEENRAFVNPAINLAPIIDNYYYLKKEYNKMSRKIQVKQYLTQDSIISISIKIKDHRTPWLKINSKGTFMIETLLPHDFSFPIKAKLEEDTLSMYKIKNKIRAKLVFEDRTILGKNEINSFFYLYADSCKRRLNKKYVNHK